GPGVACQVVQHRGDAIGVIHLSVQRQTLLKERRSACIVTLRSGDASQVIERMGDADAIFEMAPEHETRLVVCLRTVIVSLPKGEPSSAVECLRAPGGELLLVPLPVPLLFPQSPLRARLVFTRVVRRREREELLQPGTPLTQISPLIPEA